MEKAESKLSGQRFKDGFSNIMAGVKAFAAAVAAAISFVFKAIWAATTQILYWTTGCSFGQGLQGIFLGPNTFTSLGANFTLAIKSSLSWLIYNCVNASGGNIINAFVISTLFLVIGVALMQVVWVSPLSTIWTIVSFKWPQLIMILSIVGFPILAVIFGLVFGILYVLYSIIYVLGFWFKCLTSNEGTEFKRQLRGCSSAQKSLRRLFFVLSIVNGVKHLDPKVVTGMILFFLYIEYKHK